MLLEVRRPGRMRRAVYDVVLRVTLAVASVAILCAVGELVCRVFLPDTQLRFVSDPEALFRLAPNQVATQATGLAAPPARINRLGLRGADPDTTHPRILILGDSFTFGSGVGDDETFAARLDHWLGGTVSVINGGQPGYGIYQQVATLRRVGQDLRPRLVIVVIWQGDFLRQPPDAAERERFFRRQRLSQIVRTSVLASHLYRRLERLLIKAGQDSLVFNVGEGGRRAEVDPRAILDAHLNGMRADWPRLLVMHEEARRYGLGLFLVLWPKEDYAGLPNAERGLAERLTVALAARARQDSIPFVSVQGAMRRISSKDRLVIPNDGHPTPLAHCLAAELIGQKLTDVGFALVQSERCV